MIALGPNATRSLYSLARGYNLSLNDLLIVISLGTRLKRRAPKERAGAATGAE